VPWQLPAASRPATGNRVVFPASTLGRKGAYELREAVRALDLELVCLGRSIEDAHFWNGVKVGAPGANWLDGAAVVVLPAFVEHRPRRLLAALASGVPVIATPACGLGDSAGVTEIPAGDASALTAALSAVLGRGALRSA
jgi:glycosyltransferase involved in cell wall biosynthesis